VLTYDVTSHASLKELKNYYAAVVAIKKDAAIFVLVANKTHEGLEQEVTWDEGAASARQMGCEFIETSAKLRINVDFVFETLVRKLRTAQQEQQESHIYKKLEGDDGKGKVQGCVPNLFGISDCVVM
jgi:GTPase KRas protein